MLPKDVELITVAIPIQADVAIVPASLAYVFLAAELTTPDQINILVDFSRSMPKSFIDKDGVSVISCNGISYKRYLEIAEATGKKIAVVTDNDEKADRIAEASDFNNTHNMQHIFMGATVDEWTWEACVYKDNQEALDRMITIQAGAEYKFHGRDYGTVLGKMLNNKVDVAYQMLISGTTFAVPQYIKDAIAWLRE